MDSSQLTGRHWRLMSLLFVGLALDTMKPAMLSFVLPGLTKEYHLVPAQAAILPLIALLGTTVGSIVFGMLVDLMGRRLSFILTALILSGTAICGFMPGFGYNVVMCFFMGFGAGGELPVVYTLLAETMPTRHRGWLSVMLGGLGGLCGFLLASTAAFTLEPVFTWRILFLPNLPTSLVILLLSQWVPESPRFLMQRGYPELARKAMEQVGLAADAVSHVLAGASSHSKRNVRELFQGRMRTTTILLCLYGFAWGLCNWGFLTWLPTMLRDSGYNAQFASGLLARSALIALPGTILAAALYALWSSKRSAALFALGTSVVLVTIGVASPIFSTSAGFVSLAVIALLITSGSMSGILAPYSVELYPTALRGAGSGVIAASSKAAGLIAPLLIGTLLTVSSSVALPALAVSVPLGLAGIAIALRGTETRGRALEDLNERASASIRPS